MCPRARRACGLKIWKKIWANSVVGTQRNSTLKTWSFIEKMEKKGFLFFWEHFFHKKARAHAHVHVLSRWVAEWNIWQYLTSFQSWISLGSDDRIGSNFFSWLRVCLLYVDVNMPRAPRAHAVLWRHVPKKVKKPNFLNFCRRKKLNTKIWGRRKF